MATMGAVTGRVVATTVIGGCGRSIAYFRRQCPGVGQPFQMEYQWRYPQSPSHTSICLRQKALSRQRGPSRSSSRWWWQRSTAKKGWSPARLCTGGHSTTRWDHNRTFHLCLQLRSESSCLVQSEVEPAEVAMVVVAMAAAAMVLRLGPKTARARVTERALRMAGVRALRWEGRWAHSKERWMVDLKAWRMAGETVRLIER